MTKLTLLLLSAAVTYAQTASTGYTGPSILSRPGYPVGRAAGQPLAFQFYVSALGRYETDLTAPATDEEGNLTAYDNSGGEGIVGAHGVLQRQRDQFALDYRGNYRAYVNRKNFNGSDQYLALSYARQLSPKTEFFLSQGATTYASVWGGLYSPVFFDPLPIFNSALDEGFDARTRAIVSMAGFDHRLSRRWIVGMTGSGFYIDRRSKSLIDSRGYNPSATLTYLLGPHRQIGIGYSFTRLHYPNNFGDSWINTTYLMYGQQIGPAWTLSLAAGAYRAENERLVPVRFDPVLAALVGRPVTLEAFHNITFGAVVRATLARQFRRSVLSFYYDRGVTPGNSFITTAQRDLGGVSYSYLATRDLNVGFRASYHRHKAITQAGVRYETYGGGIGLNYRLTGSLYLTGAAFVRHQTLLGGNLDRDRLELTAGISWSPGEIPLSLW